jgi:L-ascorbate metabolism protein UlaG (beta-lactamase superfamily)
MLLNKTPEKNAIMFVWFNRYAGILLKTPSKTIVIDPVDVKSRNLQGTDAILVTHEHYDHLDQRLINEIQKNTNCHVISDPASARSLKNTIPPAKLEELRAGTETKIGEVTIKAEKSKHPAAQPITLIITSEDGVKIFHTADSAPYPEMAAIGEREKFDLTFCTVGIAPGATPETGFEIARLTKPQVAAPYHTNTTESQKKFAEILKTQMPKTTCLIPEQNKIYQISKRR